MTKQLDFDTHPPGSRLDYNRVFIRISDAPDLEYVVLIAHVLVYEELCWLLGARLRTDTLPERMPLFEAVVGLALAGSRFTSDRELLQLLNSARNEVAHRTNRPKFEAKLREFSSRLWRDKKYGSAGFKWTRNNQEQVDSFMYAVGVLSARLSDYFNEFKIHRRCRVA